MLGRLESSLLFFRIPNSLYYRRYYKEAIIMAKVEILAEIEMEDAIIEIRLKPKSNRMNLQPALMHMKSLALGEKVERNGRCRNNIYFEDEDKWNKAKRMTLDKFGVRHVEDIPLSQIKNANDFCIQIIDMLCLLEA